MRAMQMRDWGEPEELTLVELDEPTPGPGQVLVEVKAAGCNFPDILMVQGKYQVRPPLPFSPGAEVAGVVKAVGSAVTRVQPGQRVLALLPWGGYASHALAAEAQVFVIPDAMPFDEAACFALVYQTSYFALVHRAPVHPGQTLLVHGAAGGVGSSAVQIGKALGARVLATAGSEEKRALVRSFGADDVFDSHGNGWVSAVKEATGGRGADHIYDPVGGEVFDLSLKCIAFAGNLHVVGFASGSIPHAAMNRVLLKNVSLVGLHWGAYQQHDPGKIAPAMDALFAMYAKGQLAVNLGARFPLEQAAQALHVIRSRGALGKVLIEP